MADGILDPDGARGRRYGKTASTRSPPTPGSLAPSPLPVAGLRNPWDNRLPNAVHVIPLVAGFAILGCTGGGQYAAAALVRPCQAGPGRRDLSQGVIHLAGTVIGQLLAIHVMPAKLGRSPTPRRVHCPR